MGNCPEVDDYQEHDLEKQHGNPWRMSVSFFVFQGCQSSTLFCGLHRIVHQYML